jgi:hypothetical protein
VRVPGEGEGGRISRKERAPTLAAGRGVDRTFCLDLELAMLALVTTLIARSFPLDTQVAEYADANPPCAQLM